MTTLLTMKGFNKTVTPITTAWIYHSPSLWLISLSSDWTNWITIADKNLWATQVYNDWDTLSEANCGKYYQWWNNYWFPFTWAVTTSSTQVNASTYWPWNYYSSSTFIYNSYNWDTSNNKDIWWWETWTNEAMKWPCDTWYHIPSKTDRDNLVNIVYSLFWSYDWPSTQKYLKLPLSWQINYTSAITNRWTNFRCWTATWQQFRYAYDLDVYSSIATQSQVQAAALTIRPFANIPVIPDDSRTVLYPTN